MACSPTWSGRRSRGRWTSRSTAQAIRWSLPVTTTHWAPLAAPFVTTTSRTSSTASGTWITSWGVRVMSTVFGHGSLQPIFAPGRLHPHDHGVGRGRRGDHGIRLPEWCAVAAEKHRRGLHDDARVRCGACPGRPGASMGPVRSKPRIAWISARCPPWSSSTCLSPASDQPSSRSRRYCHIDNPISAKPEPSAAVTRWGEDAVPSVPAASTSVPAPICPSVTPPIVVPRRIGSQRRNA